MDSLISAAAQALAAGDPLGALNRVALRDDPPALALRGIAMARLGDVIRAKELLRQAARGFGPKAAMARARCAVAEAEIALAARDLSWPTKTLAEARTTLEQHGDRTNAAYARSLEIRRMVLVGQLDEAERGLADLDPSPLHPAARTIYELIVAGLALRRLQTKAARSALERASRTAHRTRSPELHAEIERAATTLSAPAARLTRDGEDHLLQLDEVEALFRSDMLILDACRLSIRQGGQIVPLARRPVLFALARRLVEKSPDGVPRAELIAHAFRGKDADESHRARLRVEIGRLRHLLRGLAEVNATKDGFALRPGGNRDVVVLAPPVEDENAPVLACLADGEAWSSSGLAVALGESQRTVQRALDTLASSGKVQSFGRGRAQRWTCTVVTEFATALLLPAWSSLD
ncbi:helix-turn-helix domain-containing protein [Bradyrhizobium sp. 83002]|uniref:helix-turn-helix domain-containing protein n=1 Tax=Bradyrhizobium aeschynomenes TaxID=2734909 RepID=UPI001554CA1A|nr:helix-turn-helix domain-containing protein [Bradyrhizobium aeschynomenes]NPU09248.1 helix-turn-helix domain-containing protein [Bradyrhizobium aeschynomenes]NPV20568.1 helix-turn-helix domain-containing protein [Bradyrhizobium aeschynomenes]